VHDHDAGVLQGGRDAGLRQEALLDGPRRLALAGRLDDLQGDGPVEGRVARLVDHPHAAVTDLTDDLVPADRGRRPRHAHPAGLWHSQKRSPAAYQRGGACERPTCRFWSSSMATSSRRTAAAVSGRSPISGP
jgi:hypothetical protein